jgi:hypothetical protein
MSRLPRPSCAFVGLPVARVRSRRGSTQIRSYPVAAAAQAWKSGSLTGVGLFEDRRLQNQARRPSSNAGTDTREEVSLSPSFRPVHSSAGRSRSEKRTRFESGGRNYSGSCVPARSASSRGTRPVHAKTGSHLLPLTRPTRPKPGAGDPSLRGSPGRSDVAFLARARPQVRRQNQRSLRGL